MNKIADLDKLKDIDIYSLSMFALYKISDIPEYSAISELPYILDKENMLRLCQYFGGRTIHIPTSEELYSLMNMILLYQYVNIDGKTFEEAVSLLGYDIKDLRKVRKLYNKLANVLANYNFQPRVKYD